MDDLLYRSLVDEVVQPQLVRVLKLKLVVVGKEAQQREGLGYPRRAVRLVYELTRRLAKSEERVAELACACLHDRWEEVSLYKIGEQAGLVGA
jgi:hypothetical protein